jgi:hypothetical protein
VWGDPDPDHDPGDEPKRRRGRRGRSPAEEALTLAALAPPQTHAQAAAMARLLHMPRPAGTRRP